MGSQGLTDHYARDGLVQDVLDSVRAMHGDQPITVESLAGLDQFHLGGRVATSAVVESLKLDLDDEVLDVGCGIGGVSRHVAAYHHIHVTGIDLTPEFVEVARVLSDLVGSGDTTTFDCGNALDLPYANGRFQAVTMIHVGMNITDKTALAHEIARVVASGGEVAIYDIVRRSEGEPSFPLPWAADSTMSSLERVDVYLKALGAAGLTCAEPVDRTDLVLDAIAHSQAEPPAVTLAQLMGPRWPEMFGNLVSALRAGIVAPVEIYCSKKR